MLIQTLVSVRIFFFFKIWERGTKKIHFFFSFHILFIKRDRDTGKVHAHASEHTSISWLTSQHLQWSGRGQAGAGIPGLDPGLSSGQRNPNYLSHHLLLFRLHINRQSELALEPGLELRNTNIGCVIQGDVPLR